MAALLFPACHQTYQKLRQQIVPLLRSRHSQYLMPFSFWPEVYMRKQPHIYELRSDILALKHVSMIIRFCRDVLKVSAVFLSSLRASPHLLFSARILA